MRAHDLAAQLLALPDAEVLIAFDEKSCDENPEGILEGTAEGTPTEVRYDRPSPGMDVVAVTITLPELVP